MLGSRPLSSVPLSAGPPFTGGGGTFPALCLVSGVLQQKAAATGADVKVYLTSAGELQAKTSAGGGDRLVNLVAGALVAA
jgi:hypothetical protein